MHKIFVDDVIGISNLGMREKRFMDSGIKGLGIWGFRDMKTRVLKFLQFIDLNNLQMEKKSKIYKYKKYGNT